MKQSVVEDNTDIAPINWEANGALVEERIEKQREWLLMAGWVFFQLVTLQRSQMTADFLSSHLRHFLNKTS